MRTEEFWGKDTYYEMSRIECSFCDKWYHQALSRCTKCGRENEELNINWGKSMSIFFEK